MHVEAGLNDLVEQMNLMVHESQAMAFLDQFSPLSPKYNYEQNRQKI